MSKLTRGDYDYIREMIGSLMMATKTMGLRDEAADVSNGLTSSIGSLVVLDQGMDALILSKTVEIMALGLSGQGVTALDAILKRERSRKLLEGVELTAADVIPNFNPECN